VKLARLAGISPRHLREVKRGSNVTLKIVKALMTALQMESIRLGEGKGSRSGEGVRPEVLLMIADAMEKSVTPVLDLIAMLRAYGQGNASSAAELNARALELVRHAVQEDDSVNETRDALEQISSKAKRKKNHDRK
jgi:methyl-accepting chemotaxis protein